METTSTTAPVTMNQALSDPAVAKALAEQAAAIAKAMEGQMPAMVAAAAAAQPPAQPPKEEGWSKLEIGLAVLGGAAVLGVGGWLLFGRKSDEAGNIVGNLAAGAVDMSGAMFDAYA